MVFLRKWVMIALVGAVCGNVVTLLIAPAAIGWYVSSADASAMCNCLSIARTTASRMIEAQGIGSGIGALVFLIAGFILGRARRRRRQAAQVASAPPPVAS
jgi:hypothetical protein